MLDAPEESYASETGQILRGSSSPKRMMAREFTDYEDDFDEDDLPGQRRQTGVRVRMRGGMPRSRAGKVAAVFAVLAILGLCGGFALMARTAILHDERFMIPSATAIETVGNTHVSRAQLVDLFGEDIERNIFRVPLDQRKARLEELPWVHHATVMRLLPNRLRVMVVERTPVAFVRQENHIGLVDANGILLDMPSENADKHYSFPVLTGMAAKDPLSLREARMKLYTRFMKDLDSDGEKISEKISEVDLSSPEDVRALIQDKAGEVLVHFGEDNFLDRYKKFEEHLPEWRQQYPHLASVDMRYERQVVLEMQPGTTAPIVGEQQEIAGESGHKPTTVPAATGTKSVSSTHSGSPAEHAVVKKKTVASKNPPTKKKLSVKQSTPGSKTVSGSKGKAHRESFWVHPKQSTAATKGSSTEVKSHSPQVVHP